jgi:hypothetical protein
LKRAPKSRRKMSDPYYLLLSIVYSMPYYRYGLQRQPNIPPFFSFWILCVRLFITNSIYIAKSRFTH